MRQAAERCLCAGRDLEMLCQGMGREMPAYPLKGQSPQEGGGCTGNVYLAAGSGLC